MNLAPFAGLFAALVLLLLKRTSSGEKHSTIGGCAIYRYPPAFAYTCLLGSVLFASGPWWGPMLAPKDPGDLTAGVIAVFAVAAVLALVAFVVIARYRVVLSDDAIQAGSFTLKKIKYCDVIRVKFVGSAGKGVLIIYSESGQRIKVEASVVDFSSLIEEIKRRLPTGVMLQAMPR